MMNENKSAQEERREDEQETRREFKRSRAMRAMRRLRMIKIFVVVGIGIGIVLMIWVGIWAARRRAANLPGRFVEDQGREHVGPEHTHSYNSNPPTSGWHFPSPAEWGTYDKELPDEILIHNLEHGGIWISYKPTVSEELRKELEAFHEKWGRKVIVTPRSKNDTDIAVAAWNRLDTFSADEFSEERVDNFIKSLRNKGPEFVP